MNRRETLKTLGIGTLSASVLLAACKTDTKDAIVTKEPVADKTGRQDFEIIRDKSLQTEKFFDPVEMATITVLADLIIPKDEHSGSASDAGVPDFIEIIVKDEPEHKLPMRGGLHWLNLQCMNRYNNGFKDCTQQQQIELLNEIAYPRKA
jgi:gluconate 2-dehydrogenase gamma chain